MNKDAFNELFCDRLLTSILKEFSEKTVFITGATGLIGSQLVHLLLASNDKLNTSINVVAQGRNKQKMEKVFGHINDKNQLNFYYGDIVNNKIDYTENIHLIVHAAAPTTSKDFVNNPIGVIDSNIIGTKNVLEFATQKSVSKFVFLSTMEVYGQSKNDTKRDENNYDYLDHLTIRSSYPESKKLAETLTCAYNHQKQLPTSILRLTQTFGRGVSYDDQRVFAQFGRCIFEQQNIILHTTGETKRNYLHIDDALSAILIALAKGQSGEAYNVANDNVYVSILEMAMIISSHFLKDKIKVIIDTKNNEAAKGYPPPLKINLSTNKIRKIGWSPKYNLIDMYESMLDYWKQTIEIKDFDISN